MKLNIREDLQERHSYTELLFADGFDEAIIGVGWGFTIPAVVAYDKIKCLEILVKRDGMSKAEAEEYFTFNVEGSYVGEKTPLFVEMLKQKKRK